MQNKNKILVLQDARVHYTVPKQQPHHTHHQHHTPQKDASTCRLRPCAGQTRKNKNPTTTHPTQSAKQATARSLLFQDPTVCQKTTHTHEQPPFPEPPGHKFPAARTRSPPTNDGQPQFVDIPPLSTRPSTQVMETSSTEHPPTNHRGSAEMVLVAP